MGVAGRKGKKISPIELWLFYVKQMQLYQPTRENT
jgi:hypothetical protein